MDMGLGTGTVPTHTIMKRKTRIFLRRPWVPNSCEFLRVPLNPGLFQRAWGSQGAMTSTAGDSAPDWRSPGQIAVVRSFNRILP